MKYLGRKTDENLEEIWEKTFFNLTKVGKKK